MDELNHALTEIAAIRGQMARSTEFSGYGPVTLAGTAVLALAAGWVQAHWVANPLANPAHYAELWSYAALVSAGLIAGEAVARTHRLHRGLADEMIRAALEQFLPAGVAGLLLTGILIRTMPAASGLLPGLWQILFGLGVLSTCRVLPRATVAVGIWYLGAGFVCLGMSGGAAALSPWAMVIPFGSGQSLAAVILWRASRESRNEKY